MTESNSRHDPFTVEHGHPIPDPNYFAQGNTRKKPDECIAQGHAHDRGHDSWQGYEGDRVDVEQDLQYHQAGRNKPYANKEYPHDIGYVGSVPIDQILADQEEVENLQTQKCRAEPA